VTARGLFITGTDTEVGKTWVTVRLLRALNAAGVHALGMKPVAAGAIATPAGLRNDDALALAAASARAMPYEMVNPYCFAEPLSPHLAAARAGIKVRVAAIAEAYAALARAADVVLVEGAGGWLAPLSPRRPMAVIAERLRLPVVLVVGLRLGCLNHAQLTARAVLADGLPLAGWIGNAIDPTMACRDDNIATLRALLPAPCLGIVGHGEDAPAFDLAPFGMVRVGPGPSPGP
jgi:dethiobiotin synthetase